MKELVKECYGKATRAAMGVGIVLVVGSALFAWFIEEKSLEDGKSRRDEVEETDD